MVQPVETPRLLTYQESANVTGQHPRTIARAVAAGKLRAVVLGPRTIRIHPSDLARYIDSCRQESV